MDDSMGCLLIIPVFLFCTMTITPGVPLNMCDDKLWKLILFKSSVKECQLFINLMIKVVLALDHDMRNTYMYPEKNNAFSCCEWSKGFDETVLWWWSWGMDNRLGTLGCLLIISWFLRGGTETSTESMIHKYCFSYDRIIQEMFH